MTVQAQIHSTTTARDRLYIDGAWRSASTADLIDVINAATEAVIGHVPAATTDDVDRAVAAARRAWESWSQAPSIERAVYLDSIRQRLIGRQDEIATLIAREVGTPVSLSQALQVGLPITSFASMAEHGRSFAWEQRLGNSLIVREPIGVVAAITPWNYPLHQIAAKVAPALAAGCTVVLKPSQSAPLNAFVLAEIIDEVGLPAGVFNLLSLQLARAAKPQPTKSPDGFGISANSRSIWPRA